MVTDSSTVELIHLDCLEWMRSQPAASIDCVVTSPPYNLGVNYSTHKDDQPRKEYLSWLNTVFRELRRVLKEDGHFFLNVGYSNKDPWISMEVAQVGRKHCVLQNRIVWVKSISIGETTHGHFKPINSNRFITPTNEDIFHFTKTGAVPIDKLAVGVPYEDKSNLNKEGRARGRIVKDMGFDNYRDFQKRATDEEQKVMESELRERMVRIGDAPDRRDRGNTWFIAYDTIQDRASERGKHPATFPVALPEMCIRLAGLREGAVVYDPFLGTGTTLVAAKRLGLRGIGTDIDAEYLGYARRRLGTEPR